MADITQFLSAVTVGARVQEATSDITSAASAAGYAAWVQSITGAVPSVSNTGDGRAVLNLSDAQSQSMQTWLDSQMSGMFKPAKDKPKVDYQLGKYMTPWAVKYFVPVGVGLFVLGWVSAYYMQR